MIDPGWFIAAASWGSAILALSLALGLREWVHRPRVRLILHSQPGSGEFSDRVVTKRISTGKTTAFVRLRLDNQGRSTARRVGVRVLQVHSWDQGRRQWMRVRPELDGRLLEPSNQLADEPGTVDVFPCSDRIIDLVSVSVGGGQDEDGLSPVFVEIGQPWPPNQANALGPGTWRLELLVCADNINAQRYFVTVSFDGRWPELDGPGIWDHLRVDGPSRHQTHP
jgi:hypothetical protein